MLKYNGKYYENRLELKKSIGTGATNRAYKNKEIKFEKDFTENELNEIKELWK